MTVLPGRPTVTVDVGPLFEDMWTGIPVFTRRLVQSLLNSDQLNVRFCCLNCQIPNEAVLAAIKINGGIFLREKFQTDAAKEFSLIDRDSRILYPSVKGSLGVGAVEASTVHDLSTLCMPENHEEANIAHHLDHFEREIFSDDAIFCASDATREALVLAYPMLRNKASTLYQYVDWPDDFELIERNMPPIRLGRYAVVIGTIEPRKNLRLLIDALTAPELARSSLKFVVIGKKGWLVDEFLAGLDPEVRSRILFSGFVSEFIKYRLIKAAEFLIFPTVYEGFGIPALEAMSLGKPVLASRSSSLPEVVGDGGVYFDPFSISEFAAGFSEISNTARLSELAEKAKRHAAGFHWRRMAEPVLKWALSQS